MRSKLYPLLSERLLISILLVRRLDLTSFSRNLRDRTNTLILEVNHCIALFPGERNHPYLVCSYEIVVHITLMTEYDLGRSYVNVSTIHTLELRV